MCGIYGSTRMYDIQTVKNKLALARFRGPDATHVQCLEDKLWFGHNRLSIIDLDARSHQPFEYRDVTIVYNGEIYNFQEIRETLLKMGYSFTTTSDTEVVCAAYKHWGSDCVSQFNGMFAFVLYDRQKQLLFGARDRLGKKPFYYSLADGYFEFASQPAQIAFGNAFALDENSISQFLVWQQIPDPNTIYTAVKKLHAGYFFTYHLKKKEFDTTCYWDLDKMAYGSYLGNYEEAVTELDALLKDAVSQRMIADVPLGVFLSGGIDSSLVAALAQQSSSTPVKTFAIKFNEKGFDESPYAEAVANHLGTQHTTITCDLKEGLSLIENFAQYYDEPFADASALPSMLLAKHTRKHVTVALSGDGGDESFVGYSRYDWINTAEKVFKIPYPLRKAVSCCSSMLPHRRLQSAGKLLGCKTVEDAYGKLMSSFNPSWIVDKAKAMSNEQQSWLYGEEPLLQRVSNYDIKTYMNNDINTKVDRATMAFSLEARAPLMDYRVVEFSRKLPLGYRYAHGVKKRILKDVLYQYIPKRLLDRPKQGFGMPLGSWFRTDLNEMVQDTLGTAQLQQIPNLNVKETQRLIEKHLAGNDDRHVLIWDLLVLVQWLNKYR